MTKFLSGRLGIELLLATVLSLAVAALAFMGLREFAYRKLDNVIYTDEFNSRQEKACAARLQNYITEESVSMADGAALDHWVNQEKDVILYLYQGQNLLYSSIDRFEIAVPSQEAGTEPAEFDVAMDDVLPNYDDTIPMYPILFSDGSAQAVLSCFFQFRFYSLADGAAGVIAFSLFVLLLLLLIRRKSRYIRLLENELKILEGGDLNYEITIRGNDELAFLAQGIDAMRRAIRERQACEEAAENANRELITAMSHDLRTPLTSLIGYLDILALKKYGSEEQMRQFLLAGREKAYRIKALSDKLFEYFLVYGKEEAPPEMELVNAEELVGQIVEESLFDLESEGFSVERSAEEISCILRADVDLLRRVFGNLFSNIDRKSVV